MFESEENMEVPDEFLEEIAREYNNASGSNFKMTVEMLRKHFADFPSEFTEEDFDKCYQAAHQEIVNMDLKNMVDKGLLDLSVDDKGDFTFFLTDLGKEVRKALL